MTDAAAGERWMRRLLVCLLVVVSVCGVASVLADFGDDGAQWHTIDRTFDRPVDTLELNMSNGSVTVETDEGGDVDLWAQVFYHNERPQPRHEIVGRTLSVSFDGCDGDVCWADYVITVPESTAVNVTISDGGIAVSGVGGAVTVRTDTGSIDLHDIAGDAEAHTARGHIEMSRMSGDIVAGTAFGDITGLTLRSESVDVDVGVGEVDLEFDGPPVNVQARAETGGVMIEVPDDGKPYDVTVDTVTEPAEIDVDTSATADRAIDVTVGDGRCVVEHG